MPESGMLHEFLDGGRADAAVFALRPDYRALLLAVDGLVPGPSEQASEELLRAAETAAEDLIDRLTGLGPDVRVARRLIAATTIIDEGH